MDKLPNDSAAPTEPEIDRNLFVPLVHGYIGADGKEYYIKSWPKNPEHETPEIQHAWLANALTTGFTHPMYFASYAPTTVPRRLNRDLFKPDHAADLERVGGQVTMQLFLADVDGPGHKGTDGERVQPDDANEAGTAFHDWWMGQRRCINRLLEEHPGLYIYRSRNGYRILGILKNPFVISNQNSEAYWTRQYVTWLNYLARKYGIKTSGKDSADRLGDWTRLQRVPSDCRDSTGIPDRFEVIDNQDPKNIGLWGPTDFEESDRPPVRETPQKAIKEGQTGAILFELFKAKGLLKTDLGNGEWDVTCPLASRHSPQNGERDYAGKTHLYTQQGDVGGVKCFSDGCSNSHPTPQSWCAEFSWREHLAARRRLGWSKLGDPAKSPTARDLELRIKDPYWPVRNLGISDPVTFPSSPPKVTGSEISPPDAFSEFSDDADHISAEDRIGEYDSGKPDKSPAQCIHQIACRMLEGDPPFTDEEIFGLLINEEFTLTTHVLKQEDPSWYVEQVLIRARDAIEAKATKAPTPEVKAVDITEPAEGENIPELPADHKCDNPSVNYHFKATFSYIDRDPEVRVDDADRTLANCAYHSFGKQRCRRIENQGDWLKYERTHWERGDKGHVRNLIGDLTEAMRGDLKQAMVGAARQDSKVMAAYKSRHTNGEDDDEKDDWKKVKKDLKRYGAIIKKLEMSGTINAVLELLGDQVSVKAENLDQNDGILVFQNAAWNAKRNVWIIPDPEMLATKHIRMNWQTPSQEARDKWRAFVQNLGFDETTVHYLKRLVGYAAMAWGTEKRFVWLRGPTGTAKSTLLKIFATVLDQYAKVTPSNQWLEQKGGASGHTDVLAGLQGIRFIWADEFPIVSRFNDALLKTQTGGRLPQTVSFKGKTSFEMVAKGTLFCASNFDPQASEDDHALADRLTCFTLDKAVKPEKVDRNFVENFLGEPFMKLAILEWIMEGARSYLVEGLHEEPMQVSDSRRQFYESQVSIEAQLEEFVVEADSGSRVPVTVIETRLNDLQQRTRQRCIFRRQGVITTILHKFPNARLSKHKGVQGITGISLRKDPFAQARRDDATEPDPDYVPQDTDGKYTAPGF